MRDPEGNRPTATPGLERVLSPIGVMLLAFSALSPAFSVYIGGDAVLHMAGTGAAVAFLLGGVAAALLGLLYAEIAAAFPGAGGVYPTLAALLGKLMAFPYIVMMLPIAFAGAALAALGMADYIRVLIPSWPALPVAFAGLAAATVIAVMNVRFGALVTGVFLGIEAIALGILAFVAATHPARSLSALLTHPVMLDHGVLKQTPIFALGLATVSGLWATGGANWALYFAEEMRDVRRRIGRVVAWTGAIASVTIAGPMILMLLSARDLPAVLGAEAPMATFLKLTAGPEVSKIVSLGVAAAIFNALVASVMGYSRYLYATGRDGVWPAPISRVLARLHPRLNSPLVATALLAIGTALICLIGEKALVILISGNVADYLLIAIAIFIGRRSGATGRDFRAPLHPLIPILALVVTALSIVADALDKEAGRPSIILLVSLFLGALAYYHVRLRAVSKGWRMSSESADTFRTPAE